MNQPNRANRAALALVVALGALGVACGNKDETASAGQRFDTAVAEAKAEAEQTGREAEAKLDQAGMAMSDAAIGAAVNAKIAQDKDLDASKIDVEVNAGVVVLRGTAPSDAAVLRAVALAKGTDGVQSVSSEIKIAVS